MDFLGIRNPIAESTEAFLEQLDETVREAASETVAKHSVRATGIKLSLADELNLAKAVKYIAAVDGLSREELTALKFLMIMAALPHELQQHVVAFDVEGVTLDHVAELFPRASRVAGYVLSDATTVAAFDGLSQPEHDKAVALGRQLGLPDKRIQALVIHARALGLAMARGERALVDELVRLRQVLIDWP